MTLAIPAGTSTSKLVSRVVDFDHLFVKESPEHVGSTYNLYSLLTLP